MKASIWIAEIRDLKRIPDREEAIFEQISKGNTIAWPFVRVGNINVASDYMSVGELDDFVRISPSLPLCRRVSALLGYRLPTVAEVDAIWKAADVQLAPHPWAPPAGVPRTEENQCSADLMLLHNQWIETARNGRTGLIAGHKKDVVEDPTLIKHPTKVAIYGWHRSHDERYKDEHGNQIFHPRGSPIQPLYPSEESPPEIGHEDTYSDYSHGFRYVYDVQPDTDRSPT